jgi:anthranilate synthase/aminodeoxychorismate synthase-like glutamine amidotransferase
MSVRLLLIDNYDSFTFNLVQGFRMLGAEVLVYRNDRITVAGARALEPSHLVVSPGPGNPGDAGISVDAIRAFAGLVPVLGVCLGHQSIVAAFGGAIVPANVLMHGKTSLVRHDAQGIFEGLPVPLEVGRYHSLAAQREDLPSCLAVSAESEDGEIMGVRHLEVPVEGLQFHPESVLTPMGQVLLDNFLRRGTSIAKQGGSNAVSA